MVIAVMLVAVAAQAGGCINYSYSAFLLAPFVDGITVVDCAVPTETTSLSTVKTLFK